MIRQGRYCDFKSEESTPGSLVCALKPVINPVADDVKPYSVDGKAEAASDRIFQNSYLVFGPVTANERTSERAQVRGRKRERIGILTKIYQASTSIR